MFNKKKYPAIGEIYSKHFKCWYTFTEDDLSPSDNHNGFIKVRENFYPREHILFYDDIFIPLRKIILEKIEHTHDTKKQ